MPTPLTLPQALSAALAHHQAGRLPQAESLYRQILAASPDHPDALHYLGVLAHQVGQHAAAESLIRQSLSLHPHNPSPHNNLGQVLRALARPTEAIDAYRRAIHLAPHDVDARCNLAIALREANRPADSLDAARDAVRLAPHRPDALLQLAASLLAAGRPDEAQQTIHQTLALHPDSAPAHELLGSLLLAANRPADAEPPLRRATQLSPHSPTAFNNLGISLARLSRHPEAADAFDRALRLDPNHLDAHVNLGQTLLTLNRPTDAASAFSQALHLRPNSPTTLLSLGAALSAANRLDDALAAWQRALDLDPTSAIAHNNIASALTTTGRAADAIPHYRQALALDPSLHASHSNLLLDLHYLDDLPPEQLLAEHRAWSTQHASPIPPLPPSPRPHRPDKLRIGYFSPDFRAHSVADFIAPLLAGHDRARFEIACYAHVHSPDVFTDRLRSHADLWRDITPLSEQEAADLVRADQIDILVDLAGHTAHGRLLLFARKPAPVQITYLGYPDTTGLPAMDFRLTDLHADPPGLTDDLHTERLLRLPRTAWCYHPYPHSPEVSPLPADSAGHVTFASFNNLAKVTPATVSLWSRVLHAVPNSRLLIKAAGLSSPSARQRLLDRFAAHNISPARLDLLGRIEDFVAHLAAYHRADVALDTFPYHGTTTTCEALYMGLPVVTLAGRRTHVSRVGVSLLTNIGLPDLIAPDPDAFVSTAAHLAADPARLRHLRSTLRPRMERSPLMDAPAFVRDVEDAYRHAWSTYCLNPPPCDK